MEKEISSEDREMIVQLKGILDRGRFANGRQVTELYNRVFGTRLPSTNCSSCIRKRISMLWKKIQE